MFVQTLESLCPCYLLKLQDLFMAFPLKSFQVFLF